MTLAMFATQTKVNADAALCAASHWTQLPEASFITLAYKTKGRSTLIAFCNDLLCLAQVIGVGRRDWDLTYLPFEFFEDVVPVLNEIEDLVRSLAGRKGCSWLREMAVVPCLYVSRVLIKVREMRRELESSTACKGT